MYYEEEGDIIEEEIPGTKNKKGKKIKKKKKPKKIETGFTLF